MNMLLKYSALVLFAIIIVSGCKKNEDPYATYTPEREAALIKEWLAQMVTNKKDIDTTSTGIYYIVEKEGTGETVKTGNKVTVKYTGLFLDGSVFDASAYRGDGTMTYIHKTDRLIQGWEEGIEVMKKGGTAAFLIPSAKAYGTAGSGSIPPNTPLIFVIEVIEIK
ncbi:MAG: FKBP-type peptidyl-prolyl cis-trans isomerase [Bacteroidota bacterium]|nr:hypothetical protein [Odoribacter sp.]MDP3643575.1 FKBP-type peptidyl-prolyl cis-trans isomerase [Bacteroidota bacterium]